MNHFSIVPLVVLLPLLPIKNYCCKVNTKLALLFIQFITTLLSFKIISVNSVILFCSLATLLNCSLQFLPSLYIFSQNFHCFQRGRDASTSDEVIITVLMSDISTILLNTSEQILKVSVHYVPYIMAIKGDIAMTVSIM